MKDDLLAGALGIYLMELYFLLSVIVDTKCYANNDKTVMPNVVCDRYLSGDVGRRIGWEILVPN